MISILKNLDLMYELVKVRLILILTQRHVAVAVDEYLIISKKNATQKM